MRENRYTWDANHCAPYESTWSLLQKFAMLNACNTRDIQREFGQAIKRAHPQNWSDRDRDLHGWGSVNSSLVQQELRLTELQVKTATTLTFIRPDEAKVLACRALRICPECVKQGFHTPLQQLVFISKCPLHKCLLRTHCFECGKPTAPYSLVRAAFQTPYGCGGCGTGWWRGGGNRLIPSFQIEAQFRILQEVGDWLIKRRDEVTVEAEISKLARFTDNDQEFSASVRQLPHRWADVIGVAPPHRFAGRQRDTDLHIMMESVATKRTERASIPSGPKSSFVPTYRAIRRYLTRRFHKHHRKCFENMGKGIWFPVTRRELDARRFCQAAYALLLWRMLWERVEVPQKFFSRQLLLVQTEMELAPHWIPPSIPQDVAQRLFAIECLRTYRRCCELAEQMQHKDKITFPVWRLSARRMGEWIIQRPKSTNTHTIHWWWPKRWDSNLKFLPHRTNSEIKSDLDNKYWIAC